jgi:hypothetical protein
VNEEAYFEDWNSWSDVALTDQQTIDLLDRGEDLTPTEGEEASDDSVCTVPEDYPFTSGIALKSTTDPMVYLFAEDGCLHWYVNEEAYFEDWNSWSDVVVTNQETLDLLDRGADLHAGTRSLETLCRATLYAEKNFQGVFQVIESDRSDFREEQIGNDTVSSVRIEGQDCFAKTYQHIDYAGIEEIFTASDADLSTNVIGENQMSSIRLMDEEEIAFFTQQSTSVSKQGGFLEALAGAGQSVRKMLEGIF